MKKGRRPNEVQMVHIFRDPKTLTDQERERIVEGLVQLTERVIKRQEREKSETARDQ